VETVAFLNIYIIMSSGLYWMSTAHYHGFMIALREEVSMNPIARKENQKGGVGMESFFPEGEKARFENIRERARKLGVLGISFSPGSTSLASASEVEYYESVLDIIEEDKEILDENAGESGVT